MLSCSPAWSRTGALISPACRTGRYRNIARGGRAVDLVAPVAAGGQSSNPRSASGAAIAASVPGGPATGTVTGRRVTSSRTAAPQAAHSDAGRRGTQVESSEAVGHRRHRLPPRRCADPRPQSSGRAPQPSTSPKARFDQDLHHRGCARGRRLRASLRAVRATRTSGGVRPRCRPSGGDRTTARRTRRLRSVRRRRACHLAGSVCPLEPSPHTRLDPRRHLGGRAFRRIEARRTRR